MMGRWISCSKLSAAISCPFATGDQRAQAFDERKAVEQPASAGAVGAPLTQQGLGLALPDFKQLLNAAAVDDGFRAGLKRGED